MPIDLSTDRPNDSARWVLLPGTLCTPAVFAPVLDALGVPGHRRAAVTLDAGDVGAYADRLRDAVEGAEIVCGFSLGAMVAAHNLGALRKARAVVLLACNPFPDPPGNRATREAVRDRVLRGDARGWIEESWPAMSTAQGAEPRETVIGMAEDMARLIPAQTELAASRPGADAQLAQSDARLVFVTGAQDRLTPVAQMRGLARRAAHAHLSVLDGLGHFALLEAPDRVARAIQRGLAEVSRAPKTQEIPHDTPTDTRFAS